MHPSQTTPMMKQYLAIKSENPDALLFYRMGDFYEMFFEDARIASPILDIALTSRNKTDEFPVPMCGVPYRAVQGYISKLIDQGFKVALCDQTEDASLAKGLVKREVVQVITPGMLIEEAFLDEKSNNFVVALCCNGDTIGLSCIDISTGAFRVTQSETWDVIRNEMGRISPREVLLPREALQGAAFDAIKDMVAGKAVTRADDQHFEFRTAREKLIEQFHTQSLEGFGCESLIAGVGAAGALLAYVQNTQKQAISHVSRIETYFQGQFLLVDDVSCRNLELMKTIQGDTRKGTLLSVLDHTMTAMGGRRLKSWMRYPLMDGDAIRQRLDAVEEAVSVIALTHELRGILKSVGDIERLSGKIVMNRCNARDLLALGMSIEALPEIRRCLSGLKTTLFQWESFSIDLPEIEMLGGAIRNAIREDAPLSTHEGDMIRPGYHAGLDELIQISSDGKGWLAKLEAEERRRTGIQTLKVRYNRVFGYYIEVSKNQADAVPAHYVRKQTLVNAERYITDELKTFENKILHAEEERAALEYQIFMDIRKAVVDHNPAIQRAADMIADIDCLLNLAHVADQNDYVRPEIRTDGILSIEDGRHPVIEQMITGERFVPNSIFMDDAGHQVLIITGPNMAGKSTVLRQVALQVLMAQMGSFVPAKSAAISMTDRIFTRVGALDNLSSGQSTFMVEMQETANILNGVTPRSLVIMDEIGRGTSTYDGFSIAWAVVCYLHDLWDKGVKTLFATHYHELMALEQIKPRVKNYNISVKEWQDQIIFLRKLVEGGASRSYGIQVAQLAGVPEAVVRHAKTILSDIESGNHQFQKTLSLNAEKNFSKPTSVQLTLFPEPENTLIAKLMKIEITSMTPLDALNCLNELRHEAIQARG